MACCFSANEEQEAAPVKEGRKYPILASRGWSASNLLPHYLFLFVLTVGGDEPETALNAAHRLSPLSWEQWRNYFLVCVFLKSVMMYVHLGLGPPWVEYACAPCACVGSLLRLPSTIQDMRWIGNSWPGLFQYVAPDIYCRLEIYLTWTPAGHLQHVYMTNCRVAYTRLVDQLFVLTNNQTFNRMKQPESLSTVGQSIDQLVLTSPPL